MAARRDRHAMQQASKQAGAEEEELRNALQRGEREAGLSNMPEAQPLPGPMPPRPVCLPTPPRVHIRATSARAVASASKT